MFLLESIKAQAKAGRCAVRTPEYEFSYRQLDDRSEAFASYLISEYPGQKPVLIYGHKEADFLSCMYGSLKAGRAYIPIDISFPHDRLMQVIDEVKPEVVVDLTGTLDHVLKGQELADVLDAKVHPVAPSNWVGLDDTCYIIFTSGSTGKPKGVPINLRNLANMFASAKNICRCGKEPGVCLNCVSYSFDLSVMSVWVAVGLGMTLYTIDKKITENFRLMFEALKQSGITLWVTTPSYAEVCCMSEDFNSALLPTVEKFFFCGEILTNKLASQLLERFPGAVVLNTYGPTEATVFVTSVSIDKETADAPEPLPVGRFFDSIHPRIVDEDGNEVPNGQKGQLQLIGDSVSEGYLGRPDLNEKAFFKTEIDGKLLQGYNTGDLCVMKGDMLHYCGRNDLQIKLNGFRIEIEDIEKNLMKLSSVKRAAVCPIYSDGKVESLVAFVLPEGESDLPRLKRISAMKNELGTLVPAYMIPKKFVLMDVLPTNANGKVDKKALLATL